MKKALKIFGIFLIVVIAAIAILPIVFKDDIKTAIDDAIKENVNGTVFFDPNSFGVSLIKDFPSLTISMGDFGIIGASAFEGDTLAAIKDLSISVNVMSVISGDKIKMDHLILDGLYLNAIVLKDSSANYLDIIKDTTTQEEEVSEPTEFAFSGKWEIKNSRIKYKDASSKMFAEIKNLNHQGEGDFTQDIFDLITNTSLEGLTFAMENEKYLDNVDFNADLTLNMDLLKSKYTFKDNLLKLNDFSFGFDGWLQMNEDESIDLDLTYETKETKFKNILSLVPGVFMEGFENIKTKGSLAFNGNVKGKYDTVSMPSFNFNLKVADAMFKYPDLPSAVENIAIDLAVRSKQNLLEEMQVSLKQFHLDMGDNPIDAKTDLKFKGSFEKIYLNSDINAKINLGDINKFYPIEGLDLKGIFAIASKATGTLDMENNTFPSSNTTMSLVNGYVKSSEFPAPIENIAFNLSIQNENGSLQQTNINLSKFNLLLDGDPWSMTAKVNDLEAINFDVTVDGKIDFEKITNIYPLEGMTLKGKLDAKLSTKGSMADVDAENYANIPTSGAMVFSNFEYFDNENLPNGFKMTNAKLSFSPSKIAIENLDGYLGNSDIKITGELSNYINFAFKENETLKGSMTFMSNTFDVDEWMVEDPNAVATTEEEVPLEVVQLPTNIDFTLLADIDDVKYDNMGIKNMEGAILMKNGKACFEEVTFDLIGGEITLNGCYDPTDIKHPRYDFGLNIKDANITDAYKTFNTVKKLAPMAESLKGKFSTNFNFNGELDQEMMPIMDLMSGKGLINIAEAKLTGSNFLGKLSKLTGLNNLETSKLSSMLLDAEIKNGRLHIAPFDTKLGVDNFINASGSNGLDGSLDYILQLDIPSGKVGEAVGSALSSFTGTNLTSDRAKFGVAVGGLATNPKLKLSKSSMQNSVTNTVKGEVKQVVTQKKEEVIKDAKKELKKQSDQILATAQKQANLVKAQAAKTSNTIKKQGYAQATKLANSSKNPIQKRINKVAADQLRKETDKKAAVALREGNKQADSIMARARKEANKIYK